MEDWMGGALDGIRVIDWTQWQFGPVSTMMLSDLGAEVIKLEAPNGEPARVTSRVGDAGRMLAGGLSAYFESLNRGKKSITANLKDPAALEMVYRLAEKSDVFVQNWRFGVADRLGLGYETLKKYNPKLIYASATGFGPYGPEASKPAFDGSGAARSGLMWTFTSPETGEEPFNPRFADQMGGIMLSYGILGALVVRERQGIGQQVFTSHLGASMWLQALRINMQLLTGNESNRFERKSTPNPLFNYYRCKDGRWISLSMVEQERYWEPLCRVLGAPELSGDPRFSDYQRRGDNSKELIAEFDRIFAAHSLEHWVKRLTEGGDFIFDRVQTRDELVNDPQVIANDYIVDVAHATLGNVKNVNLPTQLTETPPVIRGGAPTVGQHTEEILTGLLGYTREEIDLLRENKSI